MSAIHRRRSGQTFKWLVAFILFLLAMTITFDDVCGSDSDNINPSCVDSSPSVVEQPASVIPETASLILLGGGLSALYVARRRRNMN